MNGLKKENKIILSLLFSVIVFMFTIVNVNAKEAFNSGDKVIQEGKYNSTVFALGKKIISKADIDGISFAAGETLNIEGVAPYGFFAGNTITLNKNITKDVFIAGKNITLTESAQIDRDAYIAGSDIEINSLIKRDLRVGGSSVDLSGATINGDVNIGAEEIIFDENTKILGKLTYNEDAKVKGLKKETASKVKVEKDKDGEVKKEENKSDQVLSKVKSFVFSILRTFIVMITLLWLLPRLNKKLKEEEFKPSIVAKRSLIGLAVLLVIPIVALIALFTGLLTSLSLITIGVYSVSLYLASIFVYYVVGNYIDMKFIKKDNMYLSLICGILVIRLVGLIPVLGGIVRFIVFLYGFGIIFNYINSLRNTDR